MPLDPDTPIDEFGLSSEAVERLRSIGATHVGVLRLMTRSDFENRLNPTEYATIIEELRDYRIKPKSELSKLKRRASAYDNTLSRLPIGYIQVCEVITEKQRLFLEENGITTWGDLTGCTMTTLASFAVDEETVFTQRDIERLDHYLKGHDVTLSY